MTMLLLLIQDLSIFKMTSMRFEELEFLQKPIWQNLKEESRENIISKNINKIGEGIL